MWIIPKDKENARKVSIRLMATISQALAGSRFTACLEIAKPSFLRHDCLKISRVRLRVKKDYCGQHPGPCQINPFFQKKHRKSRCLEGLDWVGWNNLLNDVCDKRKVDADIFSFNRDSREARYYIRRGTDRRIHYPHEEIVRGIVIVAGWLNGDFEADFADYCGKAPPKLYEMDFDRDTPGLASYKPNDEKAFFALMAEHEEH